MRSSATHHTGVGFDGCRRYVAAIKDALVGLVEGAVGFVQAGSIDVQAVGVLHDEFAHADQTATGANFVAELGLDVVEQFGQLPVGIDFTPGQLDDDLLVGHRQRIILPPSILELDQGWPHTVPTTGVLPKRSRVHHWHVHFLAFNSIHLLAENVLDFEGDAPTQVHIGVEPGAQRTNKVGP